MTSKLDSCAQTWYDPIGAYKSGLVLPQLRQEIHSIYGEQDSSRHAHWPASMDVAFKRHDIWEALLHMADSIAALHWTPLTTPHIVLNAGITEYEIVVASFWLGSDAQCQYVWVS